MILYWDIIHRWCLYYSTAEKKVSKEVAEYSMLPELLKGCVNTLFRFANGGLVGVRNDQ